MQCDLQKGLLRLLILILASIGLLDTNSAFAQAQPKAVMPDDTYKNTELVRQFIQDVDEAWGSGDLAFYDKWVTPDFKVHFNSGDEYDYVTMRQDWLVAHSMFARARHDIHLIVAEGDLVSLVTTLHMMDHIGEVEGIAPTGRNVSVADFSSCVWRMGNCGRVGMYRLCFA